MSGSSVSIGASYSTVTLEKTTTSSPPFWRDTLARAMNVLNNIDGDPPPPLGSLNPDAARQAQLHIRSGGLMDADLHDWAWGWWDDNLRDLKESDEGQPPRRLPKPLNRSGRRRRRNRKRSRQLTGTSNATPVGRRANHRDGQAAAAGARQQRWVALQRLLRLFVRDFLHRAFGIDLFTSDPNAKHMQMASGGDDRVVMGLRTPAIAAASANSHMTTRRLTRLDSLHEVKDGKKMVLKEVRARRKAAQTLLREGADGMTKARIRELLEEERRAKDELRDAQRATRHSVRAGWIPPDLRNHLQRRSDEQRQHQDLAGKPPSTLQDRWRRLDGVTDKSAAWRAFQTCRERQDGEFRQYSARQQSRALLSDHVLSGACSCGDCRLVLGVGANHGRFPSARLPGWHDSPASYMALQVLRADDRVASTFFIDEHSSSGVCPLCWKRLKHRDGGQEAVCQTCAVKSQRDGPSSCNLFDCGAAWILFQSRPLRLSPGARNPHLQWFKYGL